MVQKMKSFLKSKLQNEKGLTLIEMLGVIVIIGIIAAITIPMIMNHGENSRVKAYQSSISSIQGAIDRYEFDNGAMPASFQELVDENYLREAPVNPWANTAKSDFHEYEWSLFTKENADNEVVGYKVVLTDETGTNYAKVSDKKATKTVVADDTDFTGYTLVTETP